MESLKNMLVTIGIPTYNRSDGFLRDALTSAVNQTYKNIEIIVSDNCSTDNTESLVRSFSDPRIRYIKHPVNIGANNNFNCCVQEAKGRYFVMLHDDDCLDADFVEACLQVLPKDKEVGVVFTGTRIIDEHGNIQSEIPNRGGGLSNEEFFIGWFKDQTALYFCSTMFNTKRLQQLGGFYSKTDLFQDVVAEVILAFKYGRADVYDIKGSFRSHTTNRGGDVATLKRWAIDCRYLMDVILQHATTEKERLRELGLRFFLRKNKRMAKLIESRLNRRLALMMVNGYFYNYNAVPGKILQRIGLK